MASVSVDASEVRAFAAVLDAAGAATERQVAAVVERGALNIKNQLVAEMGSGGTGGRVAATISYDITSSSVFGGGHIEAEIGPVKGGSGSLANFMYFGTSTGGGHIPDPSGALEAEIPRFENALLALMAEAI